MKNKQNVGLLGAVLGVVMAFTLSAITIYYLNKNFHILTVKDVSKLNYLYKKYNGERKSRKSAFMYDSLVRKTTPQNIEYLGLKYKSEIYPYIDYIKLKITLAFKSDELSVVEKEEMIINILKKYYIIYPHMRKSTFQHIKNNITLVELYI